MPIVKVHCGSAHVRGKARKYPYFVASLFKIHVTKDGRKIWVNSGTTTSPRRSMKLAKSDGIKLAEENLAYFMEGYGSLHNCLVKED